MHKKLKFKKANPLVVFNMPMMPNHVFMNYPVC